MSLEHTIVADLKAAMLSKDATALRGIRAIKAAIIVAKTSEGATGEISSEEEIKLLQKLIKQRKDSLEIYHQKSRLDLAQVEQEEIEVIEKYLPKQLDEPELRQALAKIIEEVGAASPANMSKVMSVATKQLAGRADGKTISSVVRELLSH